jgi:S-DNA-T family DNA segregation ATPase FtsK/SpoIIIE
MFEDAVRLVLEFGKASTSLLQRRLRIGYGRAAHLIDMMERDGIVGSADGPKPREVLKKPDWLSEVEETLR